MSAAIRMTVWASLAAAALFVTGCGVVPPKNDGGTGGGGGSEECVDDSDCPDPQYFYCNTITFKCEPSCRVAADCNQRPSQYQLSFCSGALGCQCDEGKCVGSLCSSDSECAANQACRSGQCVTAPAVTTVAKCTITPDLAVMKQGSKAKFWVSAWDSSNAPVIVKEGATWTSVGSAVMGSGSGGSAEFTAGNAAVTTATTSVRAAFGGTTCEAKVIVLENPRATDVAVSVIDELSGRPIAGAKVVLSTTTGTIVQQGLQDFVETNSIGYATLTLAGALTSYSVSVFHPDFSYLTVANYAGTSRVLSMVLRRNPIDRYGGYKGGFTNVPSGTGVHAGLAGMSLAGSITNLNLTALLGPSEKHDVKIGMLVNAKDVGIPAGVFLGFGADKIKNTVAAQGLNGVCYDANGNPDEGRISAGTCGTRTAWALAGDIPIADLSALPIGQLTGMSSGGINVGELLAAVVPLFKKFNSTVVRDVQFTLVDTPHVDGGADYSNQAHYVTLPSNPAPGENRSSTAQLDFTQVPLAFSFVTKLPALPQFRSSYVDGVAVIGGANVPGRGVVPLGIGVGANTSPADDTLDKIDPLELGQVGVRMAPTHHGLEGSTYGLVIAAISAKAVTDAAAGIGASALFPRLPNNKLVFDPKGASPINLSSQTFPAFPEGARFNFSNAMDGALPARSFRLSAFSGANVLRVSFSDALETRWDVLVDPASPNFTLPEVAGLAVRDRLFANGNSATGNRSPMVVQAFRMKKDPLDSASPAVGFNDYVEVTGTNADRTTDFLTAFSFLNYAPPSLAFKTPATSPAMVAAGSKLAFSVSNFSVGTGATDDGVVKLTFTGGTGCTEATLNTETPMKGSGTLEYTLSGCTGAGIQVRAQLMKTDGTTPIVPAVAKTSEITIQ